jgi:hypothetical protein
MTVPGFDADIRDLSEIAKIDGKKSSDSFENTLDLMTLLSYSFNKSKKEKEQE